jgi:RimJ/RimL family protein N-acetyltransferase
MIQCYRHADYPAWNRAVGVPTSAGIDYLIGEVDRCGHGVGSTAIAAFTTVVFDLYPDMTTVVAVPQRDNRASCRALEKAGFSLLREQDLDSDALSEGGISAVYALPRPI